MTLASLPASVRAQPQEAPPPVVDPAPPPPVVQNVPPPPVVQNVPPPPVVHNVAPAPVVQNVAPAPMQPIPDLQEQERRSGKLFLSSLGTFVLAYGLTVLAGAIRAAQDDPAAANLYVPIIGPALFWEGTNMEVNGEAGAYLILSILAQTVGFIGTFFGIAEISSSQGE
jgi:hypothetical protein